MRYLGFALAMLLVLPVAEASAQSYATQGIERYFRVEWETSTGRGGPVVSGYVYNISPHSADRVRLAIDALDGAGQVRGTTFAHVLGTAPSGNRAYFEVRVNEPGPYRVRVLSFDAVPRGQ